MTEVLTGDVAVGMLGHKPVKMDLSMNNHTINRSYGKDFRFIHHLQLLPVAVRVRCEEGHVLLGQLGPRVGPGAPTDQVHDLVVVVVSIRQLSSRR